MSISRDSFSGERALLSSRPRVSYSKDMLTPEQKPSYRHQWKGVIFSYCKVKGKSFFAEPTDFHHHIRSSMQSTVCYFFCYGLTHVPNIFWLKSISICVYTVCVCIQSFNPNHILKFQKMYFTPVWLGLLHITHCKCWYLATNQIFADIIAPTSWKLCLAWGGSASKRRTLP